MGDGTDEEMEIFSRAAAATTNPDWEAMARAFENEEETLILSERERVEEALRLTIDERGDYDDAQLERMRGAYISCLGYEKAEEIFSGIL